MLEDWLKQESHPAPIGACFSVTDQRIRGVRSMAGGEKGDIPRYFLLTCIKLVLSVLRHFQ